MNNLLQDIRYGLRLLLNKPGFTIIAVLALALGIGGNTAIFSAVNAVLLRPLPYKDSDQLVRLWENNLQKGRTQNPVSPPNYLDWSQQNETLEDIAAYMTWSPNLSGGEDAERIQGARVTASLFRLLGVNPSQGRYFLPDEDRPGNDQVVVISHGLWQRRFGSDPNVAGKTLTLNGATYTVVGVMPQDFEFPITSEKKELWGPLTFDEDDLKGRSTRYLQVIARLKPGVTPEQARRNMESIASHLEQQNPQSNSGWGVTIAPFHEQLTREAKPTLLILLGAIGFVLLIACANVANLLLARASARQKEIAVRMALGASRIRIIRQLLTESLLLSILGGGLGVLLAKLGLDALIAATPDKIPRLRDVSIDGWVIGFTLAVSLITGVLFGLVPALQASKPNLIDAIKEGQKSSGGRSIALFRNGLAVFEVALALMLLIGAGLMIKSFLRLVNVDSGFDPNNVLTGQINLPSYKYKTPQQHSNFFQQVIQRVEALPGVESAGVISFLPLSGSNMDWLFSIEGQPPLGPGETLTAEYRQVSSHYFEAMGIELLKGREFSDDDRADGQRVIAINESFAHKFFADQDPIGKRIGFGKKPDWREIVGVVADVRHFGPDAEPKAEAYVPHTQDPWSAMALVVRTSSDPRNSISAIRGELRALDKDQPMYNLKTMEELISTSITSQTFSVLVMSVFAAIALILAVTGVYAVIAYSVTQRTHEIGVRMALGAQPGHVLKLVVGQALIIAIIGVVAGIAAAVALTRVLTNLLYGVSTTDPSIFAIISVILIGVVLIASYFPARRAMKVDPVVALRYE